MLNYTEYDRLLDLRRLAAFRLVGVARVACAYLNFEAIREAQNALQGALLDYELADQKLEEHRKGVANGNAAA